MYCDKGALGSARKHTLDNSADSVLMSFDGFGQLELHQGTLQIVFGVFDFEVDIPRQMIGKEAHAQFKSKQPDRVI